MVLGAPSNAFPSACTTTQNKRKQGTGLHNGACAETPVQTDACVLYVGVSTSQPGGMYKLMLSEALWAVEFSITMAGFPYGALLWRQDEWIELIHLAARETRRLKDLSDYPLLLAYHMLALF